MYFHALKAYARSTQESPPNPQRTPQAKSPLQPPLTRFVTLLRYRCPLRHKLLLRFLDYVLQLEL